MIAVNSVIRIKSIFCRMMTLMIHVKKNRKMIPMSMRMIPMNRKMIRMNMSSCFRNLNNLKILMRICYMILKSCFHCHWNFAVRELNRYLSPNRYYLNGMPAVSGFRLLKEHS